MAAAPSSLPFSTSFQCLHSDLASPSSSSSLSFFPSSPCLRRLRSRNQQCPFFLHARASYSAPSPSSSSMPSSMYAKEMERVAAKEALLLAISDAGGENALSASGSTSKSSRIDVNERIVGLERLNPTPRPTTSPLLEGLWQFKWIGAGSPGQIAARALLQRFPAAVATLSDLNLLLLDGSAKATVTLKLFNTVASSVALTSKLTVEGPLRLKEEYLEGFLSSPSIQEGKIPMQAQNAYDQVLNAIQRLPESVKEPLLNGLKLPLTGTFERQLLISYLDDEILVARDESGAPEVLYRVNNRVTVDTEPVPEYLS